MRRKLLWSVMVALGISLVGLVGFWARPTGQAAAPKPTPTLAPFTGAAAEVEQAVLEAVHQQSAEVLAYLVYDEIVGKVKISADGQWAVAWLVLVDPKTGAMPPIEPGLVMVQLGSKGWDAALPDDARWLDLVQKAPADLVSPEEKQVQLDMLAAVRSEMPTAPLTGYYLPWQSGITRSLSQSVGHDKYTPSGSAHFSFDFYTSGQMWNLYAAKGGTVWKFKYDIPTCYLYTCNDTQPLGNYLVIKDETTTPVSYILYLHLAYDSIPANLRQVGAPVVRGQFLGIADNTGQSWGNHLHFMVHTNSASYWGTSVDITFADVDINGGRPRVSPYDPPYCKPSDVCNAYRNTYTSGNTLIPDSTPPTGDLTGLSTGQVVTAASLALDGWGQDTESGFASAQFVAYYNNAWHDLGALVTNPGANNNTWTFNYTWDLCGGGIPNGPLDVAARLKDYNGNTAALAGLKHVTLAVSCPAAPPACTPSADQVAVFERANYGGCVLYAVGDYPAPLLSLGDNDAAAMRVGANVAATLFTENNYVGRSETFWGDDPNLADNRLGIDAASSLRVMLRSTAPYAPQPVAPLEASTLPADISPTLAWYDGGGGAAFQARLTGPATQTITSTWLSEPLWRLAELVQGAYTWQVRARSAGGAEGPWSATQTFTAPVPSAPPAPVAAPFNDTMEGGAGSWTASGLWRLAAESTSAHAWWYQTGSSNYNDGTPNQGALTTPPIILPASPTYYFAFDYRYETEGKTPHWDQRWVQISVDGGPFVDKRQLWDDLDYGETTSWLHSPAINLSAYAGHTVRLRFQFATLDAVNNGFRGWGIDNVSMTTTPMASCADANEPNNNPAQAAVLSLYRTAVAEGYICPNGDVDYYRFTGRAGDRLLAEIDAQSLGSALDSYLFLLASDGTSVMAENDDIEYAVVTDSRLAFTLPLDGTYYLKVRAWKHPSVGGSTFNYRLRLAVTPLADTVQAQMTFPVTGGILPNNNAQLMVTASDPLGVSYVDFYWHTQEWLSDTWQYLGRDTDGADGWQFTFHLPGGGQAGLAVYAFAYNPVGDWRGSGAWELGRDVLPPVTEIEPLDPFQYSTAFKVRWAGADDLSGIDHYDLQWQVAAGEWITYAAGLDGSLSETWVVGEIGQLYGFRVRAVDQAGNVEPYTTTAATTLVYWDACNAPDAYETDNTAEAASAVAVDGAGQLHNFCNPESASGINDADWISFTVQAGAFYEVRALPQAADTGAAISLYWSNGISLTYQAAVSATVWGEPTALIWQASQDGVVYVRLAHVDGHVAGNGVAYQVEVRRVYPVYVPLTVRSYKDE